MIYGLFASSVTDLVAVATSDSLEVIDIQRLRAKNRGRKAIALDGQQSPVNFKFPKYVPDTNVITNGQTNEFVLNYFHIAENKFKEVAVSPSTGMVFSETPIWSSNGDYVIFTGVIRPIIPPVKSFTMTSQEVNQEKAVEEKSPSPDGELPPLKGVTPILSGISRENAFLPVIGNVIPDNLLTESKWINIFDSDSGKLKFKLDMKDKVILTVTDKYIVVGCDCNYKIRDSSSMDFTSIFRFRDGKRLTVIQQKASHAKFLPDGKLILIVGRTCKIYEYSNWAVLNRKIDLEPTIGDAAVIKTLEVFYLRPNAFLISYADQYKPNKRSYCLFDINGSRQFVPTLDVEGGFKDISKNGRFAVDKYLRVYDMESGEALQQLIPDSDESETLREYEPRITDDNRYVIFLNRNQNTVHVVTNSSRPIEIARCVLHVPSISKKLSNLSTLTLGNSGRTIVVCDNRHFFVFSLKHLDDPLKSPKVVGTTYDNNADRSKNLLRKMSARSSDCVGFQKFETILIENLF